MKKVFLVVLLLPLFVEAQIITTITGNGTPGYTGDNGLAFLAEIHAPECIYFDRFDNLYIADAGNAVLRKISVSGIISTIAGNGTPGYTGDNGPATLAQMDANGVVIDNTGSIYINSGNECVIRKVDTFGIITTFAGSWPCGDYSGDGGPATIAKFGSITGLAIDTHNNLYVSDGTYGVVRKIQTSGIISTIAGTGTSGFNSDGIPATASQLNDPECIAVDIHGNVYIGDRSNRRVRKIDTFGIIHTIAGNGTYAFSGDGGPSTTAELEFPEGLFVDSMGNVYVCDLNRVRKINDSGIINTIAGNGTMGYSGDGGNPLLAELYTPRDVKIDMAGNLYICDEGNNRIRTTKPSHLSVNDISNNYLTLYPNPCSDKVNIIVPSVFIGKMQITISDAVGNQVKQITAVTNDQTTIYLNIPDGIYFLSVTKFEKRFTKKLIVQH